MQVELKKFFFANDDLIKDKETCHWTHYVFALLYYKSNFNILVHKRVRWLIALQRQKCLIKKIDAYRWNGAPEVQWSCKLI